MHQRWAELGFLHWPVPVAALRALVPRALTIDTHEGQAYVGLVPFTVTGARPMLMPPLPWVSDFHEVNVRTYVHLDGADPGVWFFSLDASNPVVVAAARALFLLPYHHARMEMDVDPGGIDFRSERTGAPTAACAVRYEPLGRAEPAAAGSLEHFLAERYLLYTALGRPPLAGPGPPRAVSPAGGARRGAAGGPRRRGGDRAARRTRRPSSTSPAR